jgi:nucleotide-binding universal stress UspA family protein
MKSILLIVEGRPVSKIAADIAIALAGSQNASIIAQFITDPHRVFEFEGFCDCGCGGRGLCGSGVFIEAEQEIVSALTKLGESLLMSFAALAEGESIEIEQHTDVGNKAQEIAGRASGVDLVLLGQTEEHLQVIRSLEAALSCPVLVIQSRSESMLIEPASEQVDSVVELIEQLTRIGVKVTERKALGGGLWQIQAA